MVSFNKPFKPGPPGFSRTEPPTAKSGPSAPVPSGPRDLNSVQTPNFDTRELEHTRSAAGARNTPPPGIPLPPSPAGKDSAKNIPPPSLEERQNALFDALDTNDTLKIAHVIDDARRWGPVPLMRGMSALQVACLTPSTQAATVEQLVKQGVFDLNHQDQIGERPLSAALSQGRVDLARIFLNAGAETEFLSALQPDGTSWGWKLLAGAFKQRDEELLRLLTHDAHVSVRDVANLESSQGLGRNAAHLVACLPPPQQRLLNEIDALTMLAHRFSLYGDAQIGGQPLRLAGSADNAVLGSAMVTLHSFLAAERPLKPQAAGDLLRLVGGTAKGAVHEEMPTFENLRAAGLHFADHVAVAILEDRRLLICDRVVSSRRPPGVTEYQIPPPHDPKDVLDALAFRVNTANEGISATTYESFARDFNLVQTNHIHEAPMKAGYCGWANLKLAVKTLLEATSLSKETVASSQPKDSTYHRWAEFDRLETAKRWLAAYENKLDLPQDILANLLRRCARRNLDDVIDQIPKEVRDRNLAQLSPLHLAVMHRDVAKLQDLLTNHVDAAAIDARDASGATPLYWAVEMGDTKSVKSLLDAGADPLLKAPGTKRNCIGLLSHFHTPEIFSVMQTFRGKRQQETLLHAIVSLPPPADTLMRAALKAAPALLDVPDAAGITPLMLAIHFSDALLVRELLAAGADTTKGVKHPSGTVITPLELALKGGHPEIITLMHGRSKASR